MKKTLATRRRRKKTLEKQCRKTLDISQDGDLEKMTSDSSLSLLDQTLCHCLPILVQCVLKNESSFWLENGVAQMSVYPARKLGRIFILLWPIFWGDSTDLLLLLS